jgi:hypothetical protein
MKLRAADLKHSLSQFASIAKREKKDAVRMVAKGFVKDIVAVTPPGSKDVEGKKAQKQGEASIRLDLARIMVVPEKGALKGPGPESASSVHKAQRNPSDGRVYALRKGKRKPVDAAQLRALEKLLFSRVGFLASGWNSMAIRLGVNLPAWVKRHGTKAGIVKVVETDTRFRIEGVNGTAYVGNVKDYLRRIDWTVGLQATKLENQCLAILKKAIKSSGFK